MSDNSEAARDTGLILHRWLQWISTISTGVLVALVVSGMDTWDALKAQSIRMESVPADIREIKASVETVDRSLSNHDWRLKLIESNLTKPKH